MTATVAVASYRDLTRRRQLTLAALAVALGACVVLDVALGPSGLGPGEVARGILMPWNAADLTRTIVWEIRLPMALTAVVVGAALAVAGAEMQTILNNPLGEPFTLGISAAASFGAAMSIVAGVSVGSLGGLFVTAGNAWVCAMAACLLIQVLSTLRGATAETMVLLGIALVFGFNAGLALLEYHASEQALQQVVFWTLGSLGKGDWTKLALMTSVLVAVTPLLARAAWRLSAMRMGDERAASLGVEVRRLRLAVLLGVSLVAATAVAFVGTIGFVGLVGPHVARMLVGEDQRWFLPGSLLCGAVLLSATSIVSRAIIPGVIIPVGIITALLGAPVFVALVFSSRRQLWS